MGISLRFLDFLPSWRSDHLLAKRASSITVCRSCCITNFTGLTYHSGSTSSCVQLFTGVSSARLHHIWTTSASQCPTLPVDSTYNLPTVINFMYSVIVARCSAAGPSLLLARRPGTHCQTTFEIRHCHRILLEPDWKLCCSHLTSVSAHWRLRDYALYKFKIDIYIYIWAKLWKNALSRNVE